MLNISAKYALRALIFLASCPPDEYVPIERLSAGSDVPRPYLAKIMKTLAQRGVVETKKGLNGGARLNSARKKLTFLDVCEALDDPIVRDTCFLSKGVCGGANPCAFHHKWGAMRAKMRQFLEQHEISGGRK
jgi:Rrf2 family protein